LPKKSNHDLIREAAEQDLSTFIKLVAPHRVLGDVHEEVLTWWTREDRKSHQLVLLPRDHQKSAMVAYRVAWEITRNPAVTVLYISSTRNLAEKQLGFIKDILTSDIYRRYWSDMVHKDEGKRKQWTVSEISVDHPKRLEEGVRDPTVFTAGLTTSVTGMHCNIAVLDDVVVQENAYVKEGRDKVKSQYSLLASVETTNAEEWVVGTRYHGDDLYGAMMEMHMEEYDEFGNVTSSTPVYEVFQREVEDRGDGTGEFLWHRQMRMDGAWFGFNTEVLAKKRAQYLDKAQFRAQYYNNPNDPDNEAIARKLFQYYDRRHLDKRGSNWYYKEARLNVYAAVDFAFSMRDEADYTAIVVVGMDADGNIYILDIDRFKTNKISEYYKHVLDLHQYWNFRKLRAEVTVAQDAIVESLLDQVKRDGIRLSIDKYRPTRNLGTKQERIDAILNPRYENLAVFHYKGGLTQELEEELRQPRPRHDDIKDALASAIDVAIAPSANKGRERVVRIDVHPRFGGVTA